MIGSHLMEQRYGKSERLDAGESAFFLRQLEQIDQKAYMRRYPALIARQIIPTFESVAEWARVYTWREWTPTGSAKYIRVPTDDLPSVDVTGKEYSQLVKDCGSSYQYTLDEVKEAAAMNLPLDAMRAETSRTATEQLIDATLATGAGVAGGTLFGILNQDANTALYGSFNWMYTLATKAAGGVSWGTLAAPNATGQEIANDLIGIAAAIVDATDGIWTELNIVLPIAKYQLAASTRLNIVTSETALEFALKSEYVKSIRPWYRAKGAGAGGLDRMAAFPSDPMVLGGIVPREWTPQPPQQVNLAFKVNCLAKCGGVVTKYPVAVRYADGL